MLRSHIIPYPLITSVQPTTVYGEVERMLQRYLENGFFVRNTKSKTIPILEKLYDLFLHPKTIIATATQFIRLVTNGL
jgi:hypothetical protein